MAPLKPNLQSLLVKKIRIDGGTQARADFDEEIAGEYALTLLAGEELPSAVVFFDGEFHWLADGFYRRRAHELAKKKHMICDVRRGTQRDAILYAVGANAAHGLRRTNADKRRAVEMLLDDAEWCKWPNRQIAGQCGVDEGLVRKIKRERNPPPAEHQRAKDVGAGENNGQAESADNPQPDSIQYLEDLPADQRASYEAMSSAEQAFLVEVAQADAELEEEEKQNSLRDGFRYHIWQLRLRHEDIPDVADQAEAVLSQYEDIINQSEEFES